MAEEKVKKVAEAKTTKASSYSAADITVLEGLEAVRRRPGMYIGTTGPDGLHHLVWEIFDNSRDEAMGGFADDIEVILLPPTKDSGPAARIRVADNGRGIPVDQHKQSKVSALETIMTVLHAGGKFGGEGYKVSGGLHGVGASVVNALSTVMQVEVHRDGGAHVQEYAKGKKQYAVKRVGSSKLHGTAVTFAADPEIFTTTVEYDFDKIVAHLREQAYLVKGLRITIIDARESLAKLPKEGSELFIRHLFSDCPSQTFYFEGGLRSLVSFYNRYQKPIHKNIFYIDKELSNDAGEAGVAVEIALQYVDDITSRVFPFANNIYNSEGGTHITGFRTALTRTLNAYGRKSGQLKDSEENLTGDDVLEGLTAVVSVKLREIQFEGQTKGKLGSVEARGAVDAAFAESFSTFLEENPDDARSIISKSILALKARKAAKAAKDSVLRKGALEGFGLPGKLADCQSKEASESELFIVEGDSAGGSAKQGRDRRMQAILPLRGKILNVERARLDKMLASQEIKHLILALGTAIGDIFDISKLRYHKIIIATDADVDGAHIRTLLLTLFFRHFRPVVDGGFVYIAQPPLYKIKRGKEVVYVYSDEEKNAFLGVDAESVVEIDGGEIPEGEPMPEAEGEEDESTTTAKSEKNQKKISIQRYKGLGEMNPEELWETTMNPQNRVLKQVSVTDAADADRVFDILMGEDVSSRKSFIQSNAKLANLDI